MARLMQVEVTATLTYDDGTVANISSRPMVAFVRGGVPLCKHSAVAGLKQGLGYVIQRIKQMTIQGVYAAVINPIVTDHFGPGYSKN